VKRGNVPDEVIRWQHEHGGVGMAALDVERHDRYRRCGVAADRFQDLDLGLHPDFAHLLGDEKPVLIVRNHDRGAGAVETLHPKHRVLKQRSIGNEGRNCLGRSRRDIGQRRVPDPPERITG